MVTTMVIVTTMVATMTINNNGDGSTKHSVSRDTPVQNMQSVRILIFRPDVSVQNVQSVRMVQYKMFSPSRCFNAKCSVSKDGPVQNIPPVGVFWYQICSQ
jgi:hypothetical protein